MSLVADIEAGIQSAIYSEHVPVGLDGRLYISASTAYTGAEFAAIEIAHAVDFNNDGIVDCADVDALTRTIASGDYVELYDLSRDGIVDRQDLDGWLFQAGSLNLGSGKSFQYGDANLDGVVDVADFNMWNENKFSTGTGWCSADFNADGVVDVSDFNAWNENKFTASDDVSSVRRWNPSIGVDAEDSITKPSAKLTEVAFANRLEGYVFRPWVIKDKEIEPSSVRAQDEVIAGIWG